MRGRNISYLKSVERQFSRLKEAGGVGGSAFEKLFGFLPFEFQTERVERALTGPARSTADGEACSLPLLLIRFSL